MSNATEIARLQNAKVAMKTSIENKGVTVGDITLDCYAAKIDAIKQGDVCDSDITLKINKTVTGTNVEGKCFAMITFAEPVSNVSIEGLASSVGKVVGLKEDGSISIYENSKEFKGTKNINSTKKLGIDFDSLEQAVNMQITDTDNNEVVYDGRFGGIEYNPFTLDLDGDDMSYLLYRGDHRMRLFPYVDMSQCTNGTYFMNECKLDENGQPITSVDLRGLKMEGIKIDNGNYMFNAMTNCTELILPESEWNVRATNYMFGGYQGAKIENLEKLGDDTGSTANIDHRNWFRGCPNLVEADLSGITAKPKSQNLWQNSFYQDNKLRKVWLPKTCVNIVATTQSYSMFNAVPASCVIFTDAPSQPSTWTGYWNYYNASSQCEVRYGSTHEEYEAY